jgi:hypothetical protein
MSTKTPAERKDDASTAAVNTDAPVFGVDRDGCKHRFDEATGDVVVTHDGELDTVERDVGRDRVGYWISYVGQERGWIDVWWHDKGADTLTRLGAAMQVADELEVEA